LDCFAAWKTAFVRNPLQTRLGLIYGIGFPALPWLVALRYIDTLGVVRLCGHCKNKYAEFGPMYAPPDEKLREMAKKTAKKLLRLTRNAQSESDL